MKKLILICSLLLVGSAFASDNYKFVCPATSVNVIEKENIFNKITGVNFASKKIAEVAIEKEINSELYKSKVNATLDILTFARLKNGEFKTLTLTTDILRYRAFSMSEFYATTICPCNKVVFLDKKVFFPMDIPFKYQGIITNNDLYNVLHSTEFQAELKRNEINFNGITGFKVETPKVTIENGSLFFTIPVKTIFSSKPFNIKLKANIEVNNNKIVLRNITFITKSNIISSDIFSPIINMVNPISYELKSLNGKYFNIDITKAEIVGNVIKTNGIFTINKNYGE